MLRHVLLRHVLTSKCRFLTGIIGPEHTHTRLGLCQTIAWGYQAAFQFQASRTKLVRNERLTRKRGESKDRGPREMRARLNATSSCTDRPSSSFMLCLSGFDSFSRLDPIASGTPDFFTLPCLLLVSSFLLQCHHVVFGVFLFHITRISEDIDKRSANGHRHFSRRSAHVDKPTTIMK